MKTLELTSDVVFKSFMMSEKTKEYKAKLISLITGLPEEELKTATYESNELRVGNKKEKIYKTDIIMKIKNSIISIEMNKDYYEALMKKNYSYISKIRGELLERGEGYNSLIKVFQINIDDYHRFKGNKLIYEFKMREKETGEELEEYMTIYHIDLKYLENKCYNKNSELEKLLRLFTEENIERLRGEGYMDEAINELEKISEDERIIGLYDKEKVEKLLEEARLK